MLNWELFIPNAGNQNGQNIDLVEKRDYRTPDKTKRIR